MSFTTFLTTASALMAALALREAYRFRLLSSSAAGLTTAIAALFSVTWLALIVYGFFRLAVLQAAGVALISLTAGLLCRALFCRLTGGSGVMSPESRAKRVWEDGVAMDGIREFYSRPPAAMHELIQKHSLTLEDFRLLYDRLLRTGLPPAEAIVAAGCEEVVSYYFENIGKSDHATAEQAQRLAIIARKKG